MEDETRCFRDESARAEDSWKIIDALRCIALELHTIAMLRMPSCLAKPLQHTYRLRR